MKAIEVQNEEIKTRMADGEKTIEILSDKSLEHDEKINRLNELAAQESKRVDAFEKQMNSFEIKLNQHTREIQVIN